MRLVVLGSTGGCGKLLVQEALARGHEVTAVSRRTDAALPAAARGVVCELGDRAGLAAAFQGADAVLCAVGQRLPGLAPWMKAEVPDVLERLAPVLAAAMGDAGVRRLLAISAGGVGDSFKQMPWVFRTFIRTTALRGAYADLERFEAVLSGTDLDLCLVRPTGLTNGVATGAVRVNDEIRGMAQISRLDVARWMLDQVVQERLVARTAVITVRG